MNDEPTHEEIARLEERIEALSQSIERCRKISLASKIAIIAGAIWTILTLLLVVPFAPSVFFAALAIIIGGAVLLGSNKTTWEQMDAALRQTEALRAQLISRLSMHLVSEERKTLH